ncbi:hypothetical protein AB4Z45_03925 [Paenibacillus sp. MCAF9]
MFREKRGLGDERKCIAIIVKKNRRMMPFIAASAADCLLMEKKLQRL